MKMSTPKPDEISKLSYPDTEESFQEETTKALEYLKQVDPSKVRCMAVCVIEKDPTEEQPTRVKSSHIVLGTKPQMAAMLASMYSAIGRTFDGEREAKEVPKEKVQ
jgi:hydroxypyruvate isomerase